MKERMAQATDPDPALALLFTGFVLGGSAALLSPEGTVPAAIHAAQVSGPFLALTAGGLIFWALQVASLLKARLSLSRPGQTLQAMGQPSLTSATGKPPSESFPYPALGLVAVLFDACLTWTFHQQVTALGTSPLAIPLGALALLPAAAALTKAGALLATNLTGIGSHESAELAPWPPAADADGRIMVTLGSEGEGDQPRWVSLGEDELLKSFMITGGVGFGKTQLIFRILDQLFQAGPAATDRRVSFLILDPKGDMASTVTRLAKAHGRDGDLVRLGTDHATRWNPLYARDVCYQGRFRDVAERLKAAMINYQGGRSSDPYWTEAGANLAAWLIWLASASVGEVTFLRLYQLVLAASATVQPGEPDLIQHLLAAVEKRLAEPKPDTSASSVEEDRTNLKTCRLYLESDWRRVPEKTRMNVVANLSSFLQVFLSAEAQRIFGPRPSEASFHDMGEIIESGKILLLDMTQNDKAGLCRAVGTMLKLAYQNAVMSRLGGGRTPSRLACLVLDEYQNFATSSHGETSFGDDRFFDQCRAAKGFGILATQSYATLTAIMKSEAAAQEILGQVGHKITFATDEPATAAYFRRLGGKAMTPRVSHSVSESGANARRDVWANTLKTERAQVGLSTSVSEVEEDRVKDALIGTLPPFKAVAALKFSSGPRVFTLFTRPLFDPRPEGPFAELASRLAPAALLALVLCAPQARAALPPSVCDAIRPLEFNSCLQLSTAPCTCHTGPLTYPCIRTTYWAPKAFVEVSPRLGESFFASLPPVASQLKTAAPVWQGVTQRLGSTVGVGLANGVVDDNGTSFFHVHTAPVLYNSAIFSSLPCGADGGGLCLSAMSEHDPYQWATGYFDLTQPAMAAAGAVCGLTELPASVAASAGLFPNIAADFAAGAGIPGGMLASVGQSCSIPLSGSAGVAPSTEPPCLGSLGAVFPRYGAVNGPTSIAGALMAAYKFRSLAAERFGTLPKGDSEHWQLISPVPSACLLAGVNMAFWEARGAPTPTDRFLFLVWERKSCCSENGAGMLGEAFTAAARTTCQSLTSGGGSP